MHGVFELWAYHDSKGDLWCVCFWECPSSLSSDGFREKLLDGNSQICCSLLFAVLACLMKFLVNSLSISPHIANYVSLSPAFESVACSSLLGQVMNVGVFTELLREFRWWSYPSASNCPWGAVALVALLIGLCCWIGGFITAACLLSHHCRRFVVLVIRALVASVPLPASGPDLRGRLAEYHQRSG